MSWYEKIIAAHTAVTDAVSHGKRLKSERYFVWIEAERDDLDTDNRHGEKAQLGYTDLYTKVEFDPWAAAFEASLNRLGVAWRRTATLYEEDTGFWHYRWRWGVRYA